MMNTKQRQIAYIVLSVLNAALIACSAQGIVPASWGQMVAAASFAVAMLMKEWSAVTPSDPGAPK